MWALTAVEIGVSYAYGAPAFGYIIALDVVALGLAIYLVCCGNRTAKINGQVKLGLELAGFVIGFVAGFMAHMPH